MTITDLTPLQSSRQRALSQLLAAVGDALHEEGFRRHEYAAQTLARAARHITPGAAAALSNRETADPARERAFAIVVRVVIQCGDVQTDRLLTGALARYSQPYRQPVLPAHAVA
jgi:hypothetical protein